MKHVIDEKKLSDKVQVPSEAEAEKAKQKPNDEEMPAPVSAELPEDKEDAKKK